jgi:isopenicillin N synthase-like dioxygenase
MNLISLLSWSIVSFLPAAALSMDSPNAPNIPSRLLQSTVGDFSYNDCIIDLKLLPFSCLRQGFLSSGENSCMSAKDGAPIESSTSLIHALIHYGVAIIDLSGYITEGQIPNIPANAFASARLLMDRIQQPDVSVLCPLVPTDDTVDSAHVYGYHSTGGMISKRYNQFREGFVFSDSIRSFDVSMTSKSSVDGEALARAESLPTTFHHDCHAMFDLLHDVANTCLMNIANHFQLPNDWFQQQYGPTVDSSQWHIKRYVRDESRKLNLEEDLLLPTHSDPSLVSVVILDQPDIQMGAMGLQVLLRKHASPGESINPEWAEVPWSGHKVAIVFVGSVLQYVTNGYFMALKHRVVCKSDQLVQPRMAATLFCRPSPSAYLIAPPNCQSVVSRKEVQKINHPQITFSDWMKKTAKNYEKAAMVKRTVVDKTSEIVK